MTDYQDIKVALFLAGFGNRLETTAQERLTQIQRTGSPEEKARLQALIGCPKALVPLGGSCPLEIVVAKQLPMIPRENFLIITNALHFSRFRETASRLGIPQANIIANSARSNSERDGAIVDLANLISHFGLHEHQGVLALAGDTIVFPVDSLSQLVDRFIAEDRNLVPVYQESAELAPKRGVVAVDGEGQITSLLEKPQDYQGGDFWAAPAVYMYRGQTSRLIHTYIRGAQQSGLSTDAPGNFLAWLVTQEKVFVHQVKGRLDIGGLEQLEQAQAIWAKVAN